MSQPKTKTKSKRRLKMPHVLVLLFCVIIIAAIATYIVPAGQFDRVEKNGRTVVDPQSFHSVEQSPVGLFGILQSIPKGLEETAYIIFFIFIVGGAFGIIQATGAVEAGIAATAKKLQGREKLIIPVVMFLFSLGGTMLGMAEETLPFIPAMVPLAIALGFDSLTGAGMVLIGAGAGFAGAFMNPFTVGVAQGIAELPMFSGMGFRIIVYCITISLAIAFVYRYASKIKENPELSPVYEIDQQREVKVDFENFTEFSAAHKRVILVVILTFALLVYGVKFHGWYITELSGLFLGMGIAGGLVAGMTPNQVAKQFIEGAKDLTLGALIVGVARGILVVLTEGHIIDTILNAMAQTIMGLPTIFGALGMYVVQCLLNIIVPSGSGQAALSMPIMAPLSDLVGVTRQTAVLAYQLGDGFSNILTPTSGYFMAGLALAGIKWEQWAKWILPLMVFWYISGGILVTIAHYIQLGPF